MVAAMFQTRRSCFALLVFASIFIVGFPTLLDAQEAKPADAQKVEQEQEGKTPQTAKPGINANFLDPELDVDHWIERFEVESREVFQNRQQVLQACEIAPGSSVADIGAGTGLYTRLFSQTVGEEGRVYAVDISPRFIDHLAYQVRQSGKKNIKTVLCTDRDTLLPPSSIDVAFLCDTYHHFEHPQETLASIRKSLRPGGKLILIDFDRIPGVSREWLLNHLRADRAGFRSEIEKAGFEYVQEVTIDGFKENYFLVFQLASVASRGF